MTEFTNELDEARKALQVDGVNQPFDGYEIIFKKEGWANIDGLNYILGLKWLNEGNGSNTSLETLSGKKYTYAENPDVIHLFLIEHSKVMKLWGTGKHPDMNSPAYYICWAQNMKINIPWLKYAIEQKFYVPESKEVDSTPISSKERDTLLIIIAALAREAKFDVSRASKTADLVASVTQEMGAPISSSAIESKLKLIPQALENRAK